MHASSNGYIYVIYVIDYLIPTFKGSVILVTILKWEISPDICNGFPLYLELNQMREIR